MSTWLCPLPPRLKGEIIHPPDQICLVEWYHSTKSNRLQGNENGEWSSRQLAQQNLIHSSGVGWGSGKGEVRTSPIGLGAPGGASTMTGIMIILYGQSKQGPIISGLWLWKKKPWVSRNPRQNSFGHHPLLSKGTRISRWSGRSMCQKSNGIPHQVSKAIWSWPWKRSVTKRNPPPKIHTSIPNERIGSPDNLPSQKPRFAKVILSNSYTCPKELVWS